jgi:hypothetical protein
MAHNGPVDARKWCKKRISWKNGKQINNCNWDMYPSISRDNVRWYWYKTKVNLRALKRNHY